MTVPMILWSAAFAIAFLLAACTQHAQTVETKTGNVTWQQEQVRMPSDPDAFDRGMVRQLLAAGADVTKPARVIYSLYIPSRRDADAAARQLQSDGYRATVQAPVGKLLDGRTETRFWLLAMNHAVPSLDQARRVRPYLEALARRYRGEYAGWGADIVK